MSVYLSTSRPSNVIILSAVTTALPSLPPLYHSGFHRVQYITGFSTLQGSVYYVSISLLTSRPSNVTIHKTVTTALPPPPPQHTYTTTVGFTKFSTLRVQYITGFSTLQGPVHYVSLCRHHAPVTLPSTKR